MPTADFSRALSWLDQATITTYGAGAGEDVRQTCSHCWLRGSDRLHAAGHHPLAHLPAASIQHMAASAARHADRAGATCRSPRRPAGGRRDGRVEMDEGPRLGAVPRIEAVQNSRGRIIVCGEERPQLGGQCQHVTVRWRTDGTDADADFVLVGIGSSDPERAEVTSAVSREWDLRVQ